MSSETPNNPNNENDSCEPIDNTEQSCNGSQQANPSLELARDLIRLEGTADAKDGELVVQELSQLPPHMLQILKDGGTQVVVCRGSVTEYMTDLRGVRPRGWPPGSTWDNVPGLFNQGSNEVVIATIGHGTSAGAHVPQNGEGHGSHDLVLHETAHAIDHNAETNHNSQSTDFNTARDADLSSLSAYETQPGQAGQEETYAESAARYYSNDPNDATNHPSLHNYWASDPFGQDP